MNNKINITVAIWLDSEVGIINLWYVNAKSSVCYKNYRFESAHILILKQNRTFIFSWAFLDLDLTKAFVVCYIAALSECLKIYRKSVLHLLKYTANIYLSRCSTDLR